jgi:hypothetical protein
MAIAKTGRTTIVVDQSTYLWWVEPWRDDAGNALHIVSEHKDINLLVSLAQRRPQSTVVISLGDRIGQRRDLRGPWRRFLAPLALPPVITPRVVRELIEWATSSEAGSTEMTLSDSPRE